MTKLIDLIQMKKYEFQNIRFSDSNDDELQKHPDDEELPVDISDINLTPDKTHHKRDVLEKPDFNKTKTEHTS
ncbi:hypothetical protein [Nitrosomonas supralitoralis]|uniref:Uncharacterized protein n=1 Tax=Nitrosomonas supralitoralis TaxID=2116706 RepID=A0A2P7NQT1_9PROT|nr:hypothetical protein [Nitrosomonas supralitoralis]PSJ15846.1 hypothetical protein C7H79_16790 [Nitrosomonas supralitoralis]